MTDRATEVETVVAALFMVTLVTGVGLVISQHGYSHDQSHPAKTKTQMVSVSEVGPRLAAPLLSQVAAEPVQGEKQKGGKQEEQWHHKLGQNMLDHPADWLIAVFTAFLFIATYRLFTATQTLVKSAERTTHSIEAAYVFAGIGGSVRILNQANGQLMGTLFAASAINHGKTPATVSTIEWGMCPDGQQPRIGEDQRYMGRIFVGWTLPGHGQQLSCGVLTRLPGDETTIFYGRITYQDLFHDDEFTTEFMHRFFPDGMSEPIEGRDAHARSKKIPSRANR